MIIYAVTGVKPSARAWTSNVDERRKSLLAILSAGMPAVVWDNVPRGTAINCQYIEAASTTEVYQDRILGVTEDRFAPAYTIMFFTGNNIHPHEDQASRSLEVSLDTDRPDPENREFKHPDPMGWTRDHRGQILGASVHNPDWQFAPERPAGNPVQGLDGVCRHGGRICRRAGRRATG